MGQLDVRLAEFDVEIAAIAINRDALPPELAGEAA